MARVNLVPTALVPNGSVVDPAGTASVAGAGNGFVISAANNTGTLYLRATNATGGAVILTLLAGSQPSAISSGQGNLTASVAATTGVTWVGPFDSSRFQQSDGTLLIETAAVLTVTAFTIDTRRV
jgi:uncharacterized protein YigA (DUF484 family)